MVVSVNFFMKWNNIAVVLQIWTVSEHIHVIYIEELA